MSAGFWCRLRFRAVPESIEIPGVVRVCTQFCVSQLWFVLCASSAGGPECAFRYRTWPGRFLRNLAYKCTCAVGSYGIDSRLGVHPRISLMGGGFVRWLAVPERLWCDVAAPA